MASCNFRSTCGKPNNKQLYTIWGWLEFQPIKMVTLDGSHLLRAEALLLTKPQPQDFYRSHGQEWWVWAIWLWIRLD